jgi:hypothetical protein
MKFRNGFVSNSSSSSFCILGIARAADWWEELLEPSVDAQQDEGSDSALSAVETLVYGQRKPDSDMPINVVEGLEEYRGDLVCGVAVEDLFLPKYENFTMKQLKEKVAASITEVFGSRVAEGTDGLLAEIGICTDGGYCG